MCARFSRAAKPADVRKEHGEWKVLGDDREMTDSAWSCQHFSLSNPKGETAGNLPELLRRVASAIEERQIDPMDLLDVTVHQEMTADGPWWSVTVYWSPDAEGAA